jgi:hypothetical protein
MTPHSKPEDGHDEHDGRARLLSDTNRDLDQDHEGNRVSADLDELQPDDRPTRDQAITHPRPNQ